MLTPIQKDIYKRFKKLVIYCGDTLVCTGIKTGDTLIQAYKKINGAICNLIGRVEKLEGNSFIDNPNCPGNGFIFQDSEGNPIYSICLDDANTTYQFILNDECECGFKVINEFTEEIVFTYCCGDYSSGNALSIDGNKKIDVLVDGTTITINSNNQLVGFDGDYDNLSNQPPINNGKLTISVNGIPIDDFTANQLADEVIDITVPINTSDLTNDSDFTTGEYVDEQVSKIKYGTSYVLVKGTGTPTENGAELEAAYVTAKGMSPTIDNEITVVIYPGEYGLSEKLVLDTEYINLVSLTGNRDVILDRADVVGDPFSTPPPSFVTSDVLLIDADYIYVKGMVGKLRNSPNYASAAGQGNPEYILPIQVGDSLANIVVENCVGGFLSFGGDTTGSNPINVSGTFTNCIGGDISFGGGGTASGTFTNCIGGFDSFGSNEDASGTFNNCTGGDYSFGGDYGIASGTFNNCTGGFDSFGGSGTLSGKLYYCRLTTGTFEVVTSPGRTIYCIDGDDLPNNQ